MVPPHLMPAFQKRLDQLNAKAASFGLDPIEVLSQKRVLYKVIFEVCANSGAVSAQTVRAQEGDVVEHPVVLNQIEIKFPVVKLGNSQVVGKLEAMEGGNLSFAITDREDDREAIRRYADHPIECDHCQTNRRRNDGYILRDAGTGEHKQVGSNCLKDYTGIDPAAALFLARMYSIVREGDDEGGYGRLRANAVDTQLFLARVAFLSDHGGFTSSARARDTGLIPTYSSASDFDLYLRDAGREVSEKWDGEIARRLEQAREVRDWVAGLPGADDFERNLKLILAEPVIELDRKRLAIAAAAVPMHSRFLGKEAAKRLPTTHVGQPGEKMTVALKIERVIDWPNRFGRGSVHLVLMRDAAGNRLKWKSAAAPREIVESLDRTMDASFKVSKHDEYEGVPQTSVTHLKVRRWLDAELTGGPQDPPPDVPKVNVAIFRHLEPQPDFRDPCAVRETWPIADFAEKAARLGLRLAPAPQQVAPEGPPEDVWFVSKGPAAHSAEWHSLHVLEVVEGGQPRPPKSGDFERLATQLAQFERERGPSPEHASQHAAEELPMP